jgi:hypothetical protein
MLLFGGIQGGKKWKLRNKLQLKTGQLLSGRIREEKIRYIQHSSY